MLTGLGYNGFATIHLHLVSTQQSCFDALVIQIELEGFIVEGDVSNWFDCEEILKKAVEIACVADVLQSDGQIVIDRTVLGWQVTTANRHSNTVLLAHLVDGPFEVYGVGVVCNRLHRIEVGCLFLLATARFNLNRLSASL